MHKTQFIFFVIMVLLTGLVGCGDSGESGQTAVSEKTGPEELGKAIGVVYVKAITDVSDLLEPKEDVALVQPKVAELKEKVIQELFVLGKQREAMETADRATVDRFIRLGISGISRKIYEGFINDYKHYSALDINMGNLVASFNIITQYANFDLLKKQNPEEAKRLGIE